MSIHQRIREARLARGMTEQALADQVGVTRGSVQQWEREGGTAPSRRHMPAATDECLQNAIAAQRGEPPTLTAYQRWADHYRETAADRRAAAAEISAAERARQSEATTKQGLKRIEDQIDNKKYTCRKDSLSLDVICK